MAIAVDEAHCIVSNKLDIASKHYIFQADKTNVIAEISTLLQSTQQTRSKNHYTL